MPSLDNSCGCERPSTGLINLKDPVVDIATVTDLAVENLTTTGACQLNGGVSSMFLGWKRLTGYHFGTTSTSLPYEFKYLFNMPLGGTSAVGIYCLFDISTTQTPNTNSGFKTLVIKLQQYIESSNTWTTAYTYNLGMTASALIRCNLMRPCVATLFPGRTYRFVFETLSGTFTGTNEYVHISLSIIGVRY